LVSGAHDRLRITREEIDRERSSSMVLSSESLGCKGRLATSMSDSTSLGQHTIIRMFSGLQPRLAIVHRLESRASHGTLSYG
jgi:hypothetical protein